MRFKSLNLKMAHLQQLVLGLLFLICGASAGSTKAQSCCKGDNVLYTGGCLQRGSTNANHILLKCTQGIYSLDPTVDASDAFDINEDGVLVTKNGMLAVDPEKFCIVKKNALTTSNESATIAEGTTYVEIAMVCFFEQEETALTYTITGSLIITSVVFLVLTLIVYAIVEELRDLQGKCIMCTCFCLCLGFLQLGISQLFLSSLNTFCTFIAFSTYFWLLATFFWMNVVSINVMRTVVFINYTPSERRLFEMYNLYGWGGPLIFLLVGIIAHHADGNHVQPGFGVISCWFNSPVATWTYFYGPILILIMSNIVLFIVTSLKLWNKPNYKNVTAIRSLKYKFTLYLKLFLVMGVSWVFEIISYVHDKTHVVWLITDIFNCLQGLIFFLVLIVFRKRALRGLGERGLLPSSCVPRGPKSLDEECDEIVAEEEIPSMLPTNP